MPQKKSSKPDIAHDAKKISDKIIPKIEKHSHNKAASCDKHSFSCSSSYTESNVKREICPTQVTCGKKFDCTSSSVFTCGSAFTSHIVASSDLSGARKK